MRRYSGIVLVALVVSACLAFAAYAGGPFVTYESEDSSVYGPMRWQDDTVTWYADTSKLSNGINNADAVAMVEAAFAAWTGCSLENVNRTNVKTCSVAATKVDTTGVDITSSNFNRKCYADTATMTCIVFDPDGSIISWFGEDPEQTVGLSGPLEASEDGTKITRGFIVLNGWFLDQGMSADVFQAAIVHEVGHLLNLDHTQINHSDCSGCTIADGGNNCTSCPTMYPDLVSEAQAAPHKDDVISLSYIYPNTSDGSAFQGDFSTISGSVVDAKGCPLKGVNVYAKRTDAGDAIALADVRSMVSGVLWPGYSGEGTYSLYGLKPGKTYQVVAEPIDPDFAGVSGLEPIEDPPQDFDTTVIAEAVTAPDAGGTTGMEDLTIDVENPCVDAGECSTDCSGSSSTSSTGKMCSLMPGSPFDASAALGVLAVIASAGAIAIRRRRL